VVAPIEQQRVVDGRGSRRLCVLVEEEVARKDSLLALVVLKLLKLAVEQTVAIPIRKEEQEDLRRQQTDETV
jgi:hypothetical protein